MKKISLYINLFSLMCMTIFLFFPPSSSAEPLDNWFTVNTASINDIFYGVAYGNNTFVAVGSHGVILTSPDGIVWTPSNLLGDPHYFFAVTYGNGKFVAVGTGGTVLISTDGVSWSKAYMDSGTTNNLYGVTYGNDKFVAVGTGGTILTSSTGQIWIQRISSTTQVLYDTIYANSIFVAVGAYGITLYSTNGLSWTPGNSTTSNDLRGVAYGNLFFVAVGDSGTILTSIDGVNWDSPPDLQNPVPVARLNGVIHVSGTFVAVGDSGTILTSIDGVNWDSKNSETLNEIYALAYGNDSFSSVGGFGTILISGIQTLPVRILGVSPGYSSVQSAYDDPGTGNGDTIQSMALNFSENLLFDRNVTVTLKGGYDSAYTTNPSSTIINGTLTISDGTVEVENIVIK
jgi:photosystem II stability/assembly factor-like uncharacterized protein